ncbi:MAG: HAMP domain-containing protein [Actinobacteria bacterium]|uniref:histidine kinase n=1 Tax=freshwater metagenome TaxID=449393 RepID=A0A6J6A0T3_9ZZZZ|nr:HAMP domain-containing protein [Actinomycetota bacterium]MSW76388.1 HAMP domain-containing protein [Actinomycetota bacterium]MSX93229.1 HAMP domain-containing protein [Actinomycetota bacterium]MSZ82276.1 HAMP domain-containing protein [Actinomycetota bacterium]MTB16545.1 HAMP domain-containing protein [Actinomycetota bacterium]
MTRRLALVIVGVVVATLLLAGAGTLTLSAIRARNTTIADVRTHATEIAANIDTLLELDTAPDTQAGRKLLNQRLKVLATFRKLMPVDDLVVLVYDRRGRLVSDTVPTAVPLTDLDQPTLLAGTTISGTNHRVAFSAVPVIMTSGRMLVVVATRRIEAGLGAAFVLFLWASGATILLALGAAYLLGRRLSRPIREASAAAQRIAAGEFSTRLVVPGGGHHDELTDLARNINDMAETLDRSRMLEQQFLLSVSHDLRTPLTSIRGYADAISDGATDPARAADIIRSESRRLERLVADLLDLAKLQAKAFTFNIRRIDLSAAVQTATDGAAGSRPGITFHPVTSAQLPVLADADRLGQALANLVENAGKYATTKVIVSARAESGWALVTVDDDGPGIAAHDLPHVFERLYVARHAPERRENSSGLGLAIVRELVASMGGEVAAGDAPGGGARLSVRLPLAD